MLSKMKFIPGDNWEKGYNGTYYITTLDESYCQETEIWKATLNSGKKINIEIGRLYNKGRFTIVLDDVEVSYFDKMVSNNECFVVSDFDYNIDYMQDLKEQWVEINGYRITTKDDIPNLNESEKMELYRIIYKWDITQRTEKSSGSESDSDSDFDEEKMVHNSCKHTNTKYALINGYKLTRM